MKQAKNFLMLLLTLLWVLPSATSLASEQFVLRKSDAIMEAKPHINTTLISPAVVKVPVGEAIDLALEYSVPANMQSFDIDFNVGPSVDILHTGQPIKLDQNRIKVPIQILARAEGRYYLNAQVRMGVKGQQQSGAFATIIQAGADIYAPPMASSHNLENADSQEQSRGLEKSQGARQKVISLPARERITRN